MQTLLIENAKYEERCDQLKATLAKAETKLDQRREEKATCLVEAATYKERCRLLERQLAKAEKQQALRMALSTHPSFMQQNPTSGSWVSSSLDYARD